MRSMRTQRPVLPQGQPPLPLRATAASGSSGGPRSQPQLGDHCSLQQRRGAAASRGAAQKFRHLPSAPAGLCQGFLLEAQRRSSVKRTGKLGGNGAEGRKPSCLLSLTLWLLHQGAGQLSAPNLYQLPKYSLVLTLAAGLHREGIQCLIDGSWSGT